MSRKTYRRGGTTWKKNSGLSAVVMMLCLSATFLLAASGSALAQVPRLNDSEKTDIRFVVQNVSTCGNQELDLTDIRQARFLLKQYEMAGITPLSNPELFKAVGEARRKKPVAAAPLPGPQPLALITDVATNNQKAFVADALSTVNGGAFVSVMTLGLFDAQENPLGPESQVEDYTGGQNVKIKAEAQFPPEQTNPEIQAIGTWFYQDKNGGQHFCQMSLQSQANPVSIVSQAPNVIYDPNLIHVCVNRTGNIGGCDYDCNKGLNCNLTPQTTPATIMYPVQGNIVYPGTIAPIQFDGNGNPTNAYSLITTTLLAVGGACTQASNVNFFKDPNTKIQGPNNNTLSWNLNPAVFGTACYQANVNANYAFSVAVTVNGQRTWAFINNTGTPAQNTLVIKPMYIFFGCVAEGTRVTLGDGTEMPIESISTRNNVLAGTRMLPVVNTISGTEDDPMVRITTQSGKSLLLSRTHPVMTTRGAVLAYRLGVGDEVITAQGPEKLVSTAPETYRGKVWNLDVGQKEDAGLTHQNSTFFANGILVGDNKMQGYWEQEDRRDPRTVLERLPQRWHQDYLNWLAKK